MSSSRKDDIVRRRLVETVAKITCSDIPPLWLKFGLFYTNKTNEKKQLVGDKM